MAMVNDENTEYQMYETGDLDVATPPTDLTKKLIDEGKAKVEPYFGVYYLTFNTEDPIMKMPTFVGRSLLLLIGKV